MRVVNFLTLCHHSLGHEKKALLMSLRIGEKSAVLKESSRSRLSSKSTGISPKTEGEYTMEKRLRVFRAHSCILLWRSEVI